MEYEYRNIDTVRILLGLPLNAPDRYIVLSELKTGRHVEYDIRLFIEGKPQKVGILISRKNFKKLAHFITEYFNGHEKGVPVNKVYANLDSGNIITTPALFQYDHGMQIVLTGSIPENIHAEITTAGNEYAQPVEISADNVINIPDELLRTGNNISCFIVRTIENERTTICKITIPVHSRPAISNDHD